MRRFAFVALVAAAACGRVSKVEPGPTDQFYRPTGIGVYQGKLVVASSNQDLRYDDETGGTLIAVDPSADPAVVTGSVRIQSFAGQMAIVDPVACGLDPAQGALALVPVRGADLLYRARLGADGALSCDGCGLPLGDAQLGDPFSVGLACGPGVARAYVGYLRSSVGQAGFAQVDLTKDPSADGAIQHAAYDFGQVRSFAYDAPRRRLYLTRTVTGASSTLRWVDLADRAPDGGDCRIDVAIADGGCRSDVSVAAPGGLELRSIALANDETGPRRAYLTARIYDASAAAAAGVRVGDFNGLLLVVDLVETLGGRLELRIVDQLPLGYGATDVVVLPSRAPRRDVVAALAADDGVLWIYDDETGGAVAIGRDLVRPPDSGAPTGAPEVGHQPFGLAVDPTTRAGNVARLYVASFQESFVTPIDVPLDDPEAACLVTAAGGCAALPELARRITGGVPGVTP